MEKIKKKLAIFVITFIFAFLLSLPVMAAGYFDDVTIKNGEFVGLNMDSTSEYTYVTLENYNNGLNVTDIDLENNDFITITSDTILTENGIICVRLKNAVTERKFFYVMGENALERSTVGYKGQGEDAVYTYKAEDSSWVSGTWTHASTIHVNTNGTPLYMSSHAHVSLITAKNIRDDDLLKGDTINGPLDHEYRLEAINTIEAVKYRYAYESHEIIPVEELLTLTYNVGARMGSIFAYSPSDAPINTKFVLYTINDKGNVSSHTWTHMATYGTLNGSDQFSGSTTSHTVAIKSAFPYATGWVVGFEIYPFGDLPEDVQIMGLGGVNTAYVINFIPSAYNTIWNNGYMAFPFEYNGANTAYVKGYADGTFRPDANITKGEAATLLARLITQSKEVPKGYVSEIPDVTVDAWYHDAVAFLEYNKAFKYLNGGKLYPSEDITRGELAQLIYSTGKFSKKTSDIRFKDLDDTHKYYTSISFLTDLGVIKGYPDGTFRPDAPISRAEAVTMINRLINLTANEKTVVKNTLDNVFPDIEGHWAEYEVLIASNDNVKTAADVAHTSGLTEDDNFIYIETDHVKIVISKDKGRVKEVINKDTQENVISTTLTPWFVNVTNSFGTYFEPINADIVNGRLHFVFANNAEAYFLVETFDNYFTVTLDSELPYTVSYLDYAQISVDCEYSDEDPNTYRISAVPMTTSTNPINFPGGYYKNTIGRVVSKIGNVIGAKIGITFSQYGGLKNGEHRKYLKEISSAIDITEGITSKKGGAFTYDEGNEALFYDYTIQTTDLSPSNATEIGRVANSNSIEVIDIHHGGGLYIQGEFNFKCAANKEEKANNTFIPAAVFKERITDKVNAEGVYLSLHTYSSLISQKATTILSVPKWQQQIEYYPEHNLSLKNDISSDAETIYVNESLSGRKFNPNGAGTGSDSYSLYSGYILIDEEIMLVKSFDDDGTLSVTRAQCGTTAAAHDANSEVRQFLCYYNALQPIPGSELYYHVAYLTGKACVEGGFDMIYLDAFESIMHFAENDLMNYYYAEFIRTVLEACGDDVPMMEGSLFPVSFWAARGKFGAIDHARRQYKKYNRGHLTYNKTPLTHFLTATSGWFNFAPDSGNTYVNTYNKTLFRDDLDLLGVIGVAYNISTVVQPFTLPYFQNLYQLIDNYTYFNTYSRLRKGNYFAQEVKDVLKAGIDEGKEYKIFKQDDGSWAFREIYYQSNIIRDMSDNAFVTGTGYNRFSNQTPYIRIEQRYSTLGTDGEVLLNLDETVDLSTLPRQKTYSISNGSKLASKPVLKVKVNGNGSETGGILISLTANGNVFSNRIDYFIPLTFKGERDIILMDNDNADFDGYSFENITSGNSTNYATFRNEYNLASTKYATITTTGDVSGVTIDDITIYSATNAPAENPSVTVGDTKITFQTTLNSGEYIEYYPDENKAYINYYQDYIGDDGTNITKQKYTEQISFTGSVTVPEGQYSFTYNATRKENAHLRAKVTIGLTDYQNVIKNPDTWSAPTVYMPEGSEKVKIREP